MLNLLKKVKAGLTDNPNLITSIKMENLKSNIDNMEDNIDKFNEYIATVKARKKVREEKIEGERSNIRRINKRIKAAIESGRKDIAKKYRSRLKKVEESLEENKKPINELEDEIEKLQKEKSSYVEKMETLKTYKRYFIDIIDARGAGSITKREILEWEDKQL